MVRLRVSQDLGCRFKIVLIIIIKRQCVRANSHRYHSTEVKSYMVSCAVESIGTISSAL